MLELKFNNKIYKKKAIVRALQAYSHLAKFNLRDYKGYARVRIDKIKPEFKAIIANEFANFVLVSTKCL